MGRYSLATPFGDASEDIVVPAVGGGVGKGEGGGTPSGGGGAAKKVDARAGPSTQEQTWLDYMYDDTARSGLAGGVLRTCTRPTLNRRTESVLLYEHSP